MTKSTLRKAFNGNSNHGERRENTPESFGRAQRDENKENTEMLIEHGNNYCGPIVIKFTKSGQANCVTTSKRINT
jgi:hypothetical protein